MHLSKQFSFVPNNMKLACVFIVVWGCACGLDIIVRSIFFSLFPHCGLSHFSPSIYWQWLPRKHNSSYNFIQSFWNFAYVFSIVWRCACAFHIILALIFVTIFYVLNFVIFWTQMYRQWVHCDCNFSNNFKLVCLKLCTRFLPGLPKCMWFG